MAKPASSKMPATRKRQPSQNKYIPLTTAAATLAVYSFHYDGTLVQTVKQLLEGTPLDQIREGFGQVAQDRLREASLVVSSAFIYKNAMNTEAPEQFVSLIYLALRILIHGFEVPKGSDAVALWSRTWATAGGWQAVARRIRELRDEDQGKPYLRKTQHKLRMWQVEVQHRARKDFYLFKRRLERKSSLSDSIYETLLKLFDALPAAEQR